MKALRRVVALALALVALCFGAPAAADDLLRAPTLTLPALPASHVTERRGPLVISYPRAMRNVFENALGRAERDVRAVASQLGVREVPEVQVRLVADAAEMRRLAPAELPPPAYAVGVAYAGHRVALVSATAPRTFEASNVAQVLRHELSHLMLAEAAGNGPVPRWLSEGVAVHQSDENTFERFQELASASWTRRLLPIARLDEGFAEGAEVNVAYAQSADLVGYLLRREGPARFAVMLEHLRNGLTFDAAVQETWGFPVAHVEEEWRRDMDDRVAFAPVWAGTGLVSLLGLVFVVVAMVRRWRRDRKILARWEREERRARWTLLGGPHLRLVRKPAGDEPAEPTVH